MKNKFQMPWEDRPAGSHMELHFLPLLAEELKADAYPYHHLSFEEAMGRLKLVIRNENQAAKNAKKE